MFQYFVPYNYLEIQPLIDAINTLAQPTCWEKIQAISTTLAVILSLVLALCSWRRSSWKNWLKIEEVSSSLLYGRYNTGVINSYPKGVYLTVHVRRKYEVPMKIISAYIWLGHELGIGYRIKEGEDIFGGPIKFQLVRTTVFKKNQKMYENLSIDDFYNERLKKRKKFDFKCGEIEVYTNTGVYKKKLTKKEVSSFNNTFREIQSFCAPDLQ